MVDLNFLIPAAIAQVLNPIGQLKMPIEIPIKEAKIETKTHPVILEAKVRDCSIYSCINH